jgi:hypothetical protein
LQIVSTPLKQLLKIKGVSEQKAKQVVAAAVRAISNHQWFHPRTFLK